jgi:hypothetical protein
MEEIEMYHISFLDIPWDSDFVNIRFSLVCNLLLFQANICEAKERVTLASLYLGTGSLEQDLVSLLLSP